MIILSWNVRGLGDSHKFQSLSRLLRAHLPDVMFIMETKKREEDMVNTCNSLGFSKCYVVERVGKSGGGLALAWKPNIQIDVVGYSQGHIDAVLVDKGNRVRLIGFYGNPTSQLRRFS